MNQATLSSLRSELNVTQQRLEGEIQQLRDVAIKATTYLEDETDAYDQHIADDASSLVERQTDMTLLANLERELEDTKSALQRMDAGTYGICVSCQNPIDPKRLAARPMATMCISCQAAVEEQIRRETAQA
jgi:DnaK suppressor protein